MVNSVKFIHKSVILCIFLFSILPDGLSQSAPSEEFSVLFYNVENLFDCRNDSLKYDGEFMPESQKRWTFNRYNEKINKIAKVILASNNWDTPLLVGLCEVENKSTLNRLIWETGLSELNYRFIHHESHDRRGIDVALLYRSDKFEVLSSKAIPVNIPSKRFYTRDLLLTKGIVNDKDTFHTIVCHWPSKSGGELHSEWKRVHAANKTKQVCDSILKLNKNSHIIIMGDLNESPNEPAVRELMIGDEEGTNTGLVNLSLNLINNNIPGTSKYKGAWSVIDQIIVTKSLVLDPFSIEGLYIVDLPFLLEEDKSYSGVKPFRTYSGPRYLGGFSDHLPVKATIIKQRRVAD